MKNKKAISKELIEILLWVIFIAIAIVGLTLLIKFLKGA